MPTKTDKEPKMFTKRIIPCLDVTGGRVVKGVNFVNLVDAGDPVEIAAAYDQAGADELWRELSAGKLLAPVSGQSVSPSQIDLVINLDQLGSTQAPITEGNGRYLMMLSDESTGRRSSLESANRESGFGFELGYDYYGSKDFTRLFFRRISDQRVFLDHGIPAVMFTSGITLLNNKPTDTPASLDYGILRDRVRLIFRYLDKVL